LHARQPRLALGLVLLALEALDLGPDLVEVLDLPGLLLQFLLQVLHAAGLFFADFRRQSGGQRLPLLLEPVADGLVDGLLLHFPRPGEFAALLLELLRFGAEFVLRLLQPGLVLLPQVVLDLVVEHVADVELVPAFGALDGDMGGGHGGLSPMYRALCVTPESAVRVEPS
jgi:hypothetical protein